MKKTYILFFILLVTLLKVSASHIVGGELELIHKRGYSYQIYLKMYVDVLHASPGVINQETEARVGLFDKATNSLIETVTLPRITNQDIDFGQLCAINPPSVRTALLTYSKDVTLSKDVYYKSTGYYIVWENCCRNEVILNIVDPSDQGMAFYLEFPPVATINNSPQFKQLKGDFPCVNLPFSYDMSGTDFNGDKLVYSLSTPLAGHAVADYQNDPIAGPYPLVQWTSGYSGTNQIHGTPNNLQVDANTGIVSFTPNQVGLFVFGITVEEFRNGVKIGEVRRDFQFQVVQCENNFPNDIELRLPNGSLYNSMTDTLKLHIDRDSCFNIELTDQNTVLVPANEHLGIILKNNNLPTGIISIPTTATVTPSQQVATNKMCLVACSKLFLKKDSTFDVQLIVTDAPKCPTFLAMTDTLNLHITYQPQLNAIPFVGIVQAPGPITVTRGKKVILDVYATDKDPKDIIKLTGNGSGFSFDQKGMLFPPVSGKDSIFSQFSWRPDCQDLDPGIYKLNFYTEDNSCIRFNKDTASIDLIVKDTTTIITTILPVNLFTPNGDFKNDFFNIPNIPEGNCDYFFKSVKIYNRWGAKVYESKDPHFKWDGDEVPSGLYFFDVDLNKKQIKSWVEIVR